MPNPQKQVFSLYLVFKANLDENAAIRNPLIVCFIMPGTNTNALGDSPK